MPNVTVLSNRIFFACARWVRRSTLANRRYRTLHYCKFSSAVVSPKLKTMKLDTPEFRSIFTPELQTLISLFENRGFEIRLVGGAVRDLLDGKKPLDLDFASTATPTQMKEMFEKENVRMVNNNGEKHGTITPRIEPHQFEVTTLRKDIKTDGRHAEVEFTTDWQEDAARRDLTINSMFLGLDGTLYDYFNGLEDLKNRRIVFVGDPRRRIQEDYLRILRYFRFYGRISNHPDKHDESTLQAIRENGDGLSTISGERIWCELSLIVGGNFCEDLIKKMIDLGLGQHMGLGNKESLDIERFETTCRLSAKYTFRAVTYIASLLKDEVNVFMCHNRLKWSSYDRDLAFFIVAHKNDDLVKMAENPLRGYQYLLLTTKLQKSQMRDYINELLKFQDREELRKQLEGWQVPVFPVSGHDLRNYNFKGKDCGVVLQSLKEAWVSSDFTMTKEELLSSVPLISNKLKFDRNLVSG